MGVDVLTLSTISTYENIILIPIFTSLEKYYKISNRENNIVELKKGFFKFKNFYHTRCTIGVLELCKRLG
jgi:hypothetical protein